MWPMIRNGGIEIIACSVTFGVRRSGRGSTVVSDTTNRTASRLTWAYSVRTAWERVPNSSTIASSRTMKSSSPPLRTSVIRPCRVRRLPLMTNASVKSVRASFTGSLAPIIVSNMRAGYPARGAEEGTGLLPGARGHQLFGPVLEPLVQRSDRLDRVDIVGRLVRPEGGDPREPERIARLVAGRADDDVEGDLDDDGRLDLAVAPEPLDRVGLEPGRHLGDLGVRQPAVGLADRDQSVGVRVADRERVVGQDAVPLAVSHFDPDDNAVDRRQRLLHLQPAEPAPA